MEQKENSDKLQWKGKNTVADGYLSSSLIVKVGSWNQVKNYGTLKSQRLQRQ